MQLRPTKGIRQAVAVPLAELLLAHRQWPGWLDMRVACEWGAQLCRIVARLHRMGCIIGDLDPATILVDSGGASSWAPVLLVSWPPARQFWPGGYANDYLAHLFPIAGMTTDNVFAAPEMLQGRCDERSDVYALGAILYLLFTRYAPVSSALRLVSENERKQGNSGPLRTSEGMSLVPPHLLNNRISTRLENILTRALALNPADRFPTAFALVEALESVDPNTDFADPFANRLRHSTRHDSTVTKVLEWVRRELND
jgi:serine/threonine protein kinase